MSHTSARPGSMTHAMSAAAGSAPKVLRLGVVHRGRILDERILRDRQTVTAGSTERCTLSVPTDVLAAPVELFVPHGERYALVLHPGAEVRVATHDGPRALGVLRTEGRVTQLGAREVIPLETSDRGKVTLGELIVLFQWVNAPPVAPHAQLPASLKNSYARNADWRYNACLASFMALAIGGLGYVEYLWDPVVPSDDEIAADIARLVHMEAAAPDEPTAPAPSETDPHATPQEAAAARTPSPTRTPSPRPQTHGPAPAPSEHQVSQAVADAQRMVDRAMHGNDASFAALTSSTGAGHRSARDQLANNGLLNNQEGDLRGLHGISTDPSAIHHGPTNGDTFLPSGNSLGRTRLTAAPVGPGPLGPTSERVITTNLICRLPAPPPPTTCDQDASAVARVFRSNLGGFRSCYERGVRNDPTLRGRVTMSFTLGESGRTSAVHVSGMTDDVDACLTSAVQRIVFDRPTCGSADFEFPVTFELGAR